MELSWVSPLIPCAWLSNNFMWFLPVGCLKSMEFWVLLFTICCLACATIYLQERLCSGGRRVSLNTRYLKGVEKIRNSIDEFSDDCESMIISKERCQLLREGSLRLVKLPQPHCTLKESFCAIRRALELMEDCCSKYWILKAVEFGDCQRHFLEILVDLHRLSILVDLMRRGNESLGVIGEFEKIDVSEETMLEIVGSLNTAWENDKAALRYKLETANGHKYADICLIGQLKEDSSSTQLEADPSSTQLEVPPHEIEKWIREFDPLTSKHIYRAHDNTIVVFPVTFCDTKVTIKMSCIEHGAEVQEARLKTEADFMKLCRHPYAVALLGSWRASRIDYPRVPFILMEFMEYDLDGIIKRNKRRWWWWWGGTRGFPALKAIELVLPVAKVMKYLHETGVVHLDLKPKNILYTRVPGEGDLPEDVSVKLADFGEARWAKDGVITRTGTSGYMDPDMYMLSKKGSVDLVKADVFGFGLVFGEVLSGVPPMEALDCQLPRHFYKKIQNGEQPPLPKETPEFVKSIVESCLKLNPDKRPSFDEICGKLRNTELLLRNACTVHE